MNRLAFLIIGVVALSGMIGFLNCADPLERDALSPVGGSTQVPDTVVVTDTVVLTDTLTQNDTIHDVDTLTIIDTITDTDTITNTDTVTIIDTVTDTVIHIDTVIIVVPDTGSCRPLCSRIACNQQEIVWMLQNAAGSFRLEFAATVEKDQPNQTLAVTIDSVAYEWDPVANPEFMVEQVLGRHATITIVPNKPPARGHAIDICLKVTAL